MRLGRPLESEVLRACVETCRAHGVMVWRNNSGAFVGEHKGKRWMFRAGAGSGSADLIGLLPGGRAIAIEVKRQGEMPRPEQYDWLARVDAQGGVACWADDALLLNAILRRVTRPDGHKVRIVIDRNTGHQCFDVEDR